jgi:hypothetical protein
MAGFLTPRRCAELKAFAREVHLIDDIESVIAANDLKADSRGRRSVFHSGDHHKTEKTGSNWARAKALTEMSGSDCVILQMTELGYFLQAVEHRLKPNYSRNIRQRSISNEEYANFVHRFWGNATTGENGLWFDVSRQFADESKGDVIALVKGATSTSIFRRIELSALNDNPLVESIVTLEEHCKRLVINNPDWLPEESPQYTWKINKEKTLGATYDPAVATQGIRRSRPSRRA